jgi:hypothetical protein
MVQSRNGRSRACKNKLSWQCALALFLLCYAGILVSIYRLVMSSGSKHSPTQSNPMRQTEKSAPGSSNDLPLWAQEYLSWHTNSRSVLSPHSNHQYLIYSCQKSDSNCGGLSDRIKSLPYMILMAARTRRIFLIHWTRPCQLEEFLMPPIDGLDWRTPDWLASQLEDQRLSPATSHRTILHHVESTESPVVLVRLQDQHGGSDYYNQLQSPLEGPRAFRRIYRTLFYKCFTPTPYLADAIERSMSQLHLVPGQYTAAHFRAKYNEVHPLTDRAIKGLARNTVNCASQLRRDSSELIFFATESQLAMKSVRDYVLTVPGQIVTAPTTKEPLHLDKATSTKPRDYFSVFIDLFLLSNARCIAHGQGGYGRLAVLLSHNASCFKSMVTGGRIIECKWKN